MTHRAPEPGLATGHAEPRGWVEFYARDDGFDVYDWSEYHDSCHCVRFCRTRAEAISVARRWAHENNRKLPQAEIIPFRRRATP